MSEPRIQLGERETPSASWHDPYSWQPGTPDLPSPSVVRESEPEPIPGSLDYLRLGCDDLWQDGCGGEG